VKRERIYLLVGRGLNAFATVFVTLITFSCFSEFYTIAVKKDIDQYLLVQNVHQTTMKLLIYMLM
jgi:hypothetical protein